MNTTDIITNEKSAAKKNLAIIIPSLLMVLIGIVGLSRYFYTQWVIEQAARFGARYATTGSYDPQYCVDLDDDNTPCDGNSKDAETDIARIPSVKEIVRRQLNSIVFDETVKYTDPGFLKITVCTSENGYYFTHDSVENMNCVPSENAGQPGDPVIVAIDYTFILLDFSFLGIQPLVIHLSSSSTGSVEEFRSTRLVNTPVPVSTPVFPNSTPSSEIRLQLLEIDHALNESMQSSFAFNMPDRMKLNDTTAIELLLNPSISSSDLGAQISENGAIETGILEISPLMKAELIAQDPEAFKITEIPENSEQIISATDTTRWTWLLTAKKKGVQTLTLVIYRLVQYQGQDYWREVQTYKSDIIINVTIAQQLESFDWMWLVGIIVTALLIPAFWRWIDKRNKEKETGSGSDGKKPNKHSSVSKKDNSKRKTR